MRASKLWCSRNFAKGVRTAIVHGHQFPFCPWIPNWLKKCREGLTKMTHSRFLNSASPIDTPNLYTEQLPLKMRKYPCQNSREDWDTLSPWHGVLESEGNSPPPASPGVKGLHATFSAPTFKNPTQGMCPQHAYLWKITEAVSIRHTRL